MPKDFLVYAAQVYIRHPPIQKGYNKSKGGLGTVKAKTRAHPTLHAQANISMKNRSL